MIFFYNLLLLLLLIVGSPLLLGSLVLNSKRRVGLAQKLGFLSSRQLEKLNGKLPIWLHGVSVGEVNSLLPMILPLKQKISDAPLLLSVGTASAYSFAMRYATGADGIIYFPFDLPFLSGRVLRRIRPRLVIITEKEIWPNFLHTLERMKIPVMWINGRLSDRSVSRYQFFKGFFRRVLSAVTCLAVDSEESQKRWIKIGMDPKKIFITGHTKVDQAIQLGRSGHDRCLTPLASLLHKKRVFIAASTHPGEEQTVCQAFQEIFKKNSEWRLLLVPRHPERFEAVAVLLRTMGMNFIRFSQWNGTESPNDAQVVLIDRIGLLAQLYSIADAAFIGGSLIPIGGHNVWEAAVFGVPMIYGPYMNQDFGLAEEGGALRVEQAADFSQHLVSFLEDQAQQTQMKLRLQDFLEKHRGAVEKNLNLLDGIHV